MSLYPTELTFISYLPKSRSEISKNPLLLVYVPFLTFNRDTVADITGSSSLLFIVPFMDVENAILILNRNIIVMIFIVFVDCC